MQTNIIGVTSNFSQNSEAIIQGADYFFPSCRPTDDENKDADADGAEIVKTGAFPDYFCPFTDSQVAIKMGLHQKISAAGK